MQDSASGLTACLWTANVKENIRHEYPLYTYAPRRDSVVAFSTPTTCTLPNGCELTGGQPQPSVPGPRRPTPDTSLRLVPYPHGVRPSVACQTWTSRRIFASSRPRASGCRAHQAGSRIPGFSKRRGTKTKRRLKEPLFEPIKISASRVIGRLRPDAVETLPKKETAK
jgi:hypothetical protein